VFIPYLEQNTELTPEDEKLLAEIMATENDWYRKAEEAQQPTAVDEMLAYAEKAALEQETEPPEERFEIIMTSDAFPDPEDAFAVWDNIRDEYYADEHGKVLTYPTEEVTMMFINISNDENPLLGNANFRKALYYACDREVLATLELTKPWPMFLHELAGGYPEENILYKDLPEVQARWPENNGYDPELAKQYFDKALAECNLTKGTLELMYIESMGSQKAFCEFLDSTLPTIFGEDKFETTLAAVPAATYSSAILDWQTDPHGYDVAFGSWIWSTTLYMPNYQFQFYTPSGQLNTTDYGCPELDEMYVRSLSEEYRFDQEKLINLTMEMDELFMDEMLAIPLTQVVGRTMISERVILAVDEYDPFLGYALMYADIDLTK